MLRNEFGWYIDEHIHTFPLITLALKVLRRVYTYMIIYLVLCLLTLLQHYVRVNIEQAAILGMRGNIQRIHLHHPTYDLLWCDEFKQYTKFKYITRLGKLNNKEK